MLSLVRYIHTYKLLSPLWYGAGDSGWIEPPTPSPLWRPIYSGDFCRSSMQFFCRAQGCNFKIACVHQVRFLVWFVAPISQGFRACLKLDAILARQQLHRVDVTKITCVNGPWVFTVLLDISKRINTSWFTLDGGRSIIILLSFGGTDIIWHHMITLSPTFFFCQS